MAENILSGPPLVRCSEDFLKEIGAALKPGLPFRSLIRKLRIVQYP
jgi:hypothetical protein